MSGGNRKEMDVAGCLQFDYDELKKATNDFDGSPGGCKLGEGGFGPVYKGKLKFTEVAIKMLRRTPPVVFECVCVSTIWRPPLYCGLPLPM